MADLILGSGVGFLEGIEMSGGTFAPVTEIPEGVDMESVLSCKN